MLLAILVFDKLILMKETKVEIFLLLDNSKEAEAPAASFEI